MSNYLDSNGLLYFWGKIKALVSASTPSASSTTPAMDGTASTGSSSDYARGDHVHPTDTSRAAASALTSHTSDTGVHVTSSEKQTWNGKANAATTLAGYGITDAYTKTETDNAITNALSGITGIDYQVVQTLPASGFKGTIYLVPSGGTTPNVYDEYIWVSNAFEKIGTTAVDLSGYWAKTELVAITNAQIDTIVAS